MKKININFSWPATLSNFETDPVQGNYTRAKLKVFYKGETEDHRYFSDDFSEELIKTLPYAPVVAHYNCEKDDFEGHASQQNIYGIVDPCTPVSFETLEDGNDWAVCDVVLYTERKDDTGDIAKKIVGHKQSMELDPNTTKYNINYDEKRHFKNIEFTAGSIIGVSVLGEDEQPAFTGSEFFSFAKDKLELLRDYCEHRNANNRQNGGENMNLVEFIKLSWGDKAVKLNEALSKEYDNEYYWYIVDFFDESVIARMYSYYDGTQHLVRINYSIDDDGVVTLGNVNDVHIEYVDDPAQPEVSTNMEQTPATEENTFNTTEPVASENPVEENTTATEGTEGQTDFAAQQDVEQQPASTDNGVQADQDQNLQSSTNDNFVSQNDTQNVDENNSNVETTNTPEENHMEASVDNEQQQQQEEETVSSSTSLNQSERTEFENLKREKKINLLNSYKQYMNEEEFVNFNSRIDEYSDTELEVELLRIYKRSVDEGSNKTERAFAFAPINNANKGGDSPLDSFVRKHLR